MPHQIHRRSVLCIRKISHKALADPLHSSYCNRVSQILRSWVNIPIVGHGSIVWSLLDNSLNYSLAHQIAKTEILYRDY